MPRPKLPPRSQVILRIDNNLLVELYALRPELKAGSGETKYGAINSYFTSLIIRDLERIRAKIKAGKANG